MKHFICFAFFPLLPDRRVEAAKKAKKLAQEEESQNSGSISVGELDGKLDEKTLQCDVDDASDSNLNEETPKCDVDEAPPNDVGADEKEMASDGHKVEEKKIAALGEQPT